MPMRWEHALITRILDTGDLRSAQDRVSADKLFQPDTRAGWNWINTYKTKHGSVPSREIFQDHHRGFIFQEATEPVAAIAERVHTHYAYNKLQLFVQDLHPLAKSDPEEAIAFLLKQGHEFRGLLNGGQGTGGFNLTTRMAEERAAYERRKELKGILGLQWPWEHMNKMTHGILDGSLNIFYARPGNMKTWLLLYVAMYVHYHFGRKPLVFTREMTAEDLQRRWVAMFAELDYTRYMEGRLTSVEAAKWEEAMEVFAESHPVWVETVGGTGEEAAEQMLAKVDELGADFLAVDSIYLFGNRQWEIMAQFTSTLKRGILERKIPCIGATQKNNPKSSAKEGSGDDVGYSDSLLQDADTLLYCKYVKEDKRIYLRLPKVREGVMDSEMSVWARPAYDFSQAYVADTEDGYEDMEISGGDDSPIAA